jgi:hypothetical protein
MDLSWGGLANVDEGGAFRMAGRYFDQVIHDFPPERGAAAWAMSFARISIATA